MPLMAAPMSGRSGTSQMNLYVEFQVSGLGSRLGLT
jgi:hypothetical protein